MRRRDARGRSGARSILLPHRWRLVILAIVWLKAEIGERGGGEGATPRRGRWKGGEGGKGGSRRRCGGRPTVTRTAVMSLAEVSQRGQGEEGAAGGGAWGWRAQGWRAQGGTAIA